MRHLLVATAAGLLLVSATACTRSDPSPQAGTQSNQSYRTPGAVVNPQGPAQPNMLGSRPADGATSSGTSGVTGGSGQGGYIGTHPGGDPGRSGQTVPETTAQPLPPRRY